MSGKVPAEKMTKARVDLVVRANDIEGRSVSKSQLLALIENLAAAAIECPRIECAYCEHQARSEAQQQAQVGEAEAG